MIKRIYLDMDGVLCDFYGAAMQQFDRPANEYFTPFPQDWDFWKHLGITSEQLWDRCRGEHFWRDLEWCAGGKDILYECEAAFGRDNIWIATKPQPEEGCYAGKFSWIKKHMPAYINRVIMIQEKHLLSSSDSLLIDDNENHVASFTRHGGAAILVPSPWNSLHHLFDGSSVLEVKRAIREYSHK